MQFYTPRCFYFWIPYTTLSTRRTTISLWSVRWASVLACNRHTHFRMSSCSLRSIDRSGTCRVSAQHSASCLMFGSTCVFVNAWCGSSDIHKQVLETYTKCCFSIPLHFFSQTWKTRVCVFKLFVPPLTSQFSFV